MFSGTLAPADKKGRKWDLIFDGVSLGALFGDLESAANQSCPNTAFLNLVDQAVKRLQLAFSKNATSAKIQLKVKGSLEEEGCGDFLFGCLSAFSAQYRQKAKGAFAATAP